jgi:hypothetical protein
MTREGGKPLIENADEIGWTAAAFERRSSTPGRSAPRPSAST